MLNEINEIIGGALVPCLLAVSAICFLIILKAAPFRKPQKLLGKTGKDSVRAVSVALAGTLGVGNIVGVASAIAVGGAGAVLWMWISALLAMILKYSEVVLALLHRRARDGISTGGAMYYMKDCFARGGHKRIGTLYATVFSVLCLVNAFTMGGMIQSNSIARSAENAFGVGGEWVSAALALSCVCVFFLGGGRIFSICEALVPLASVGYVVMCLAVIFIRIDEVPNLLLRIVREGMTFDAAAGGVLGFFTSRAVRFGTIRGLFSNEAGCGSSTIAHASSATASPTSQGVLGMFEVFVDTIVVCTMTALVVLLCGENALFGGADAMSAVAISFEAVFGKLGSGALCVFVFLFAFATMICWGYYGRECVLSIGEGRGGAPLRRAQKAYYALFCAFAFVGGVTSLDLVWQIADLAVGGMTLMNLPVLLAMRREIKAATLDIG